jgi:hypothetical protein
MRRQNRVDLPQGMLDEDQVVSVETQLSGTFQKTRHHRFTNRRSAGQQPQING